MAMIGISPLVAVVNANSPIHSIKDLIAEAKAKNGTMNFGSGGVGTTPHMAGELLAFNAGIKMVHVAYRGEAPGINDLLGGQIPFMFSNLSVVKGNVEGGKLRALAVTSSKRVPSLPDVPTVAETFPGFDAATWFALVAPAGTPRDAVTRINAETKKIVATPDFQQRFDTIGMIPDQDRTPGRDQRLHQGRDRQMGQGDPGRRREAGGLRADSGLTRGASGAGVAPPIDVSFSGGKGLRPYAAGGRLSCLPVGHLKLIGNQLGNSFPTA